MTQNSQAKQSDVGDEQAGVKHQKHRQTFVNRQYFFVPGKHTSLGKHADAFAMSTSIPP